MANAALVIAFATFVVLVVIAIELVPSERTRPFVRLLERLDEWWSSSDTTKPVVIDELHDAEEVKYVRERGPGPTL